MTITRGHDPDAPWSTAMMLLIVLLIIGAGLAWLHFGLGLWQNALEAEKPADSVERIVVNVGPEQLAVAANAIRFPPVSARRDPGKVFERLDLMLHWPSMRGYGEDLAEAFRDTTAGAPVLHVAVIAQPNPVSDEERYRRIYSVHRDGEPLAGPAGLIGHRLAEGSGYGGEILFESARAGDGMPEFHIRCSAVALDSAPSTCFRHMRLSQNLVLEYRYRDGLLARWREIDLAVRRLIDVARRG